MTLSVGNHLGAYEILAFIGAGGMGEVYRARDTKLKRDVALKVLPEAFARDPARMARFQREAELLASLNHPNIAHIYGVEERALVMEFVEGESPKGPMPFEDAWKVALQIADALEYAHERGVIHRDLGRDDGSGVQIHCLLGFVGQMCRAGLHLGDLGVGIMRIFPLVIGAFIRA